MFKRYKTPEKDMETLWAESYAKVSAQKAVDAVIQLDVLNAIGEKTDDLAERALRIADRLPVPERDIFMRNVMRRLVLQTMVSKTDFSRQKGDASFIVDANLLGTTVLSDFGSGLSGHSNVGFEAEIIDKSLPVYQQDPLYSEN